MIFIVVPTYNRVQICRQFVLDLEKQTFRDYHLYLVDHGKTKTHIKSNNKITVIESDVNGWARAINVGLRAILEVAKDTDNILIINDDVRIEDGYLEDVYHASVEKPDSVLGSCCIDINTHKLLRVAIRLNKKVAKHIYLFHNEPDSSVGVNEFIDSDVLTGKGTLFPVSVIKRIGIYNELKLPHYKADHELVWRAKKAGFNVFACGKMRLYTVSDQKKANGKEPFLKAMKFSFCDMRSIYRVRDWCNYAFCAYNKPYALYFILMNCSRNTVYVLLDYIRSK